MTRVAGLATLLLLFAFPARFSAAPPAQPTLVEKVEVILVETLVRATDRKGNPVTDLKPEEIQVEEGGDPRRLAYFEPFLSRGHEAAQAESTRAAPLYDAGGQQVARGEATVLPPRPSRRIVLAFDVVNSKIRVRNAWKGAALDWVKTSMTADDRVGIVVFRTVPEWIQRMTNDPAAVRSALETLDLEGRAPQRDRRAEVSHLFRDVSSCAEASEAGGSHATGAGGGEDVAGDLRGSARGRSEEIDCAIAIAEPYVAQWNTESLESIGVLRTLTGQLAAVPGRKEVILFSDGILADSPSLAVNTMLAVFGVNRMDVSAVTSDIGLQRDALDELTKLQESARAAGVAYFTLDTRTGAERGYHDTVEFDRPVNFKALGANPWAEAYDSTSGSLSTLADATGGRSFQGAAELTEKVARAADSYFGTYALGFYRPEEDLSPGKLKIRVKRSGVELAYAKKARPLPAPPRTARLELSIRKPEPTGAGNRQRLPVVLDVPLADLPMRNASGTYGCQLGIFVQVLRPDGLVVTEAFQDVTAAMEERPKERDPSTTYRALVNLDLEPGAYRLRARLSDDRQVMIAERAIDLTLGVGEVRGGLGQ